MAGGAEAVLLVGFLLGMAAGAGGTFRKEVGLLRANPTRDFLFFLLRRLLLDARPIIFFKGLELPIIWGRMR